MKDFIKWISCMGVVVCCFGGCIQGVAWFGTITNNTYGRNTKYHNDDYYNTTTYPNENYNDTVTYEENF